MGSTLLTDGHNEQVHWTRGPIRLTIELPKSINKREDVEKRKDERAPVPCYPAIVVSIASVFIRCTSSFRSLSPKRPVVDDDVLQYLIATFGETDDNHPVGIVRLTEIQIGSVTLQAA